MISPRIRHQGILGITSSDVAEARALGMRLRLVAATSRSDRGIAAEVAPVLVPEQHEFARTRGAENVVHARARCRPVVIARRRSGRARDGIGGSR